MTKTDDLMIIGAGAAAQVAGSRVRGAGGLWCRSLTVLSAGRARRAFKSSTNAGGTP